MEMVNVLKRNPIQTKISPVERRQQSFVLRESECTMSPEAVIADGGCAISNAKGVSARIRMSKGGYGDSVRDASEKDWQQLIGRRLEHAQNNDDTISSEVGTLIHRNNHQPLPSLYNPPHKNGSKLGSHDSDETQPMVRYQKTKVIPSRVRKRVIFKNGNVNLSKEHVYKRSQRYLQDIFTTLVDIQWRWNLLVFAMGFIVSWLIFAVVWWLIMFAHGDFEETNSKNETWKPCVTEVTTFTAAFLFSLETQHTIGYGNRYISEECPEAVFILCLQSVVGVMIQCFMVGIVFAKLSRPKKRSQTLLFSRHAVICLRDGKLCLLFRVGDMRKSHIIGTNISAQIIKRKVTQEGEVIPYYHTTLDVRFDAGNESILFIWPATIVHEINERSPLYTLSAEDIMKDRFEIVVVLEGTIESTGQSIQARSSYLPSEILWGHRFEQLVRFQRDSSEYLVDYSKFNNTYEVETPLCSARDFYEYQKLIQQPQILILNNNPQQQNGQPGGVFGGSNTLTALSGDSMTRQNNNNNNNNNSNNIQI
ncbi:ATP-sensitive inward rectifier potassium channel 12 [Galendromus occidentalis]|uniref:ATP-sensitive inward rectifier potassium channel 12 n=1 Tax=Galendromus occidentalis TaxID=34638 RepID=A0AAJ7SFS0_9ACAR|nr:ATP-sensitive inward rectifier potassium channel 12 [Galendromus occidentalis]